MHDDRIRRHITEVTQRDASQTRSLMARIQRACWTGDGADRTQPAALGWVKRWRPARAAATLPACSCEHGRCALCN
jgi:hypothetical protein